jgi:hypothetical protein
MKEFITARPVRIFEDLKKPPHVLSQFIDMLTGRGPLDLVQQGQRWQHLAGCIDCQTFLGIYLIEYEKAEGSLEGPVRELLSQLTQIMHETLKKDIPAYVDTLEEQGKEPATSHFPLFSEHMQSCPDCQLAVRDLQSWLRMVEEADSPADQT